MTDLRFSEKSPAGNCTGWLAHNVQACRCYAEERSAARRADWLAAEAADRRIRIVLAVSALLVGLTLGLLA